MGMPRRPLSSATPPRLPDLRSPAVARRRRHRPAPTRPRDSRFTELASPTRGAARPQTITQGSQGYPLPSSEAADARHSNASQLQAM